MATAGAILLLSSGSLLLQTTWAASQTPATPAARSMELQVVEDGTGKPVPGVGVLSPYNQNPSPDPATLEASLPRTDQEGRIKIPIPPVLVPPGHFYLVIQPSNHPPRNLNWSTPTGASIRDLLPTSHTIRLAQERTIGGVVHNAQGQPMSGAQVIVWGYEQGGMAGSSSAGLQFMEMSHLPRDPRRAVETDAAGRWRFDHYPATLRSLTIDVREPEGAITSFATGNSANFAGMMRSIPVDLDSLLATNALLVLKQGVTLRGIVRDSQGNPVPRAVLQEQVGMDASFLPPAITNGLDGRFELKNRTYVRGLLRVSAPGYAMALKPIQPKVDSTELQVTLAPEQRVRIQVLAADGKPVEGARVSAVPHRSGIYVNWDGTTDSQGWASWTDAPLEELVFWVSSTTFSQRRSVRASLQKREQTLRLPSNPSAATRIKIRARDEASGQPLPTFTVKRRQHAGMQAQSWGEGQQGEFTGEFNPLDLQSGMGEGWLIDVEAPGHLGWRSEPLYADEGDQEIMVTLREAKPMVGRVLDPGGKPANRASVILNTQEWGLYSHQPGIFQGSQGGISVKCDAEGNFTLAPSSEDRWVVISHPTGFASVRSSDLQKNPSITLQAWARAEGVLTIGGQPAKSTSVTVRTPLVREGSMPYQAYYSQNTDANGRFVFTNLPPGSYVFYRQPVPIMGAAVVESHPFPFDLKPAENKILDLPKGGRLVQGGFQTSEEVNWLNDPHFLQLKLPTPPDSPLWNDFTNPKEFEAARKAYSDSPELREYQRKTRQYQLEMDSAGGFHVPDVPPGTYQLKVSLTKPPAPGQQRMYNTEPIGSLEKEVIVPPGDGPVDLGIFEITVRGDGRPPSPPVDLSLQSLEGKALKLSSFRGKPAVVTLWADWALGGKEHLKRVDAIRADLKSKEEFAFVAVNLDEAEIGAKSAGADIDSQWTQVRVQGRERLALVDQLGVSTLPLTLILDAHGRVAVRDVPAERLKSSLQRAARKLAAP